MGVRRATAMMVAVSAITLLPAGAAGARTHNTGLSPFDQRMLVDINSARTQLGLTPLQLSSSLESVAGGWARQMASAQREYDNPHLRSTMNGACPGWKYVGESVGAGGDATPDQLFHIYMRDPGRRQTILSAKFAVVGVYTVATSDGDGGYVAWNALEFADDCGS